MGGCISSKAAESRAQSIPEMARAESSPEIAHAQSSGSSLEMAPHCADPNGPSAPILARNNADQHYDCFLSHTW